MAIWNLHHLSVLQVLLTAGQVYRSLWTDWAGSLASSIQVPATGSVSLRCQSAEIGAALQPKRSAIFPDRVVDDGQAEACPGLALVQPLATCQRILDLLRRKTRAIVLNADLKPAIHLGERKPDDTAAPFSGILQKIADDFFEIFLLTGENGIIHVVLGTEHPLWD